MNIKLIPGGNQMSLIRDTEEVLKFLEFVSKKSILSGQAVNCRLTACHNLFAVVNEDEDNIDYLLQNLDLLTNRFRNRNTSVQASTLKVYKSRVKSSLEDYKAWCADPFAWERSITDKAKAASLESRKEKKAARAAAPAKAARSTKSTAPKLTEVLDSQTDSETQEMRTPAGRRVSFPIRENFNVEITLPSDGLTLKELQRLGLFLYPYCTDIDGNRSPWT